MVGRELTKIHQEFLRGTASEVADHLSEPRGEFTVIVGANDKLPESSEIRLTDEDVVLEFRQMTETGRGSRRQMVTELARRSGRSAKDVYSAIERAKKLGV